MSPSPDDARIDHLVQFDEALRLGRDPVPDPAPDPGVKQTEDFLVRLQALWPRPLQRIGRYTLVRSLGQGTIGPCYLAEESAKGRAAVLKILWPDLCANVRLHQRLLQEARAVELLRGKGIVPLREISSAGSVCIVVSEYSPGPSLAQWRLQMPQPVAWQIGLALAARLADVLETAHAQAISHGNLKPSNIFLPDQDQAERTPANLHDAPLRIAEFGLASAVQQARLSAHGAHPWPMPQYLAPEQIAQRCRTAEPPCDVYAVGVLLYELLTGRSPVKVTTREEVFAQTRGGVPPPLRHYRTDIPREVDEVVVRCLAKHPRDRFASGKPLAEALRTLLPAPALEPEAPPPGWWKQWLGWR